MPNTDHREVDRHVMSCHLAPVFEGATDGAPVHPPNLSTLGMFINTPDKLHVGSLLQLQFRLAMTEIEVAVEAEVRHTVRGVDVVAFVNLSPEVRKAFESYLLAYKSKQNHFFPKSISPHHLGCLLWQTA